jgi:hypothetical protein
VESLTRQPGRWAFLGLFLLGLGLRILWLPLWGTFDTEIWKAWAAEAASDGLAPMYGPPDRDLRGPDALPLRPALFDWGQTRYSVDYPPGTLLVAWAAGKLYQAIDPGMPNRWRFNAVVNIPPLLCGLLGVLLLLRSAKGRLGRTRALAFWLNPALILAAPVLGYQDPVFAVLGLGAILCLEEKRYVTASALGLASSLVKPQGALLLPILAVVQLREARPRAWAASALAAVLTAGAILAPWWSRGYLLSALDGCLRPLRQNTLAPLGLNLWWIAGWVLEASRNGLASLAPILNVDAFRAGAGFDPRLVSRLLLAAATALNLALLVSRPSRERSAIALAVVLQVHAYALLATSVHENHTLLAVVVAPLLLGAEETAGVILWGSSGFLLASLLFAAGFGRRITPLRVLKDIRSLTIPELSVWVALFYLAFVVFAFFRVARRTWGRTGGGTAMRPEDPPR